jgi:CRP/FNR family transcriptional regulator
MLAVRQLSIVKNGHKRSCQPRGKNGNGSSEVVARLSAFAMPALYQKGAILFVEGQPSRGVFILCAGRVKLFTSSADGKTFILRFADAGEILGLAGTLSGRPYEVWAQATEPTQINFVERDRFVDAVQRNGELAVQVAMQLGESYCSAIAEVRVMGLSRSASEKLAIFLLDWREGNRQLNDDGGARLSMTHEEIAQVVGISRETVSRLLSRFKKKGLIRWKDCNLVLTDRAALEILAAS